MGVMGLLVKGASGSRGQMTIELVVVLPVVLALAVVAVNALQFFGDCAAFDREARNAIRVQCTSLTYGELGESAASQVQSYLESQLGSEYLSCSVQMQAEAGGLVRYEATLSYLPNLFGRGIRSEVFGLSMPALTHRTFLVVDPYNPGVVF